MSLTREAILSAVDTQRERVDVKEWGGYVFVRQLLAFERDNWEMEIYNARQKNTPINVRASLVVRCVVDDEGNRLFSDADAEAVGKKCGLAVDRVYEVASRLNLLSQSDKDELEKN